MCQRIAKLSYWVIIRQTPMANNRPSRSHNDQTPQYQWNKLRSLLLEQRNWFNLPLKELIRTLQSAARWSNLPKSFPPLVPAPKKPSKCNREQLYWAKDKTKIVLQCYFPRRREVLRAALTQANQVCWANLRCIKWNAQIVQKHWSNQTQKYFGGSR